jgi:hypothetical protein
MERIQKHIAQQELFEAKEMFVPKTLFDEPQE